MTSDTTTRLADRWLQAGDDTIDKPWIEHVRKTWKYHLQKVLQGPPLQIVTKIRTLIDWVNKLKVDMAFTKGWHVPYGDAPKDGPLYPYKSKAMQLIKDTVKSLDNAIFELQFWLDITTPGTSPFKMDGGQRYQELVESPQGLEEGRSVTTQAIAKGRLGDTDSIFSGKFLRHLSSIVGKHGPAEFDGGFQLAFSVGRLKVTVEEFDHADYSSSNRHYGWITKEYVKELSKAQALIERSGLGMVWYGDLLIRCKTCGGENPLGAGFGVGGHYFISKDEIAIYSDGPGVFRLMIHELGHRYYFKFMSSQDRLEFDSYFNVVPATSTYGKTVSAEDFAEVFADYVLRKDLSRDQLERFKKFLGRKKTATDQMDRTAQSAESFTEDFFRRHPTLRKYVPRKTRKIDKPGGGSHGEAQQRGDEVWLYPKFWQLDDKTKDWVFTHELGHLLLSQYGITKMMDVASALGIDLWESDKLPFGQHNMDEAFADSFASRWLDHSELDRRYPLWASLVDHVIKRKSAHVAGEVVELGQRPRTPTIRILDKTYALSTYGDALGDALDTDVESPGGARLIRGPVSNPWKYLWVYDTDRKYVAMWRATDGNEKTGGRDSHFTPILSMLDRKKQINRVDRTEFDRIERFMRAKEDQVLQELRETADSMASEEEKKLTKALKIYFAKHVVPEFQKRMDTWAKGVRPLGFKPMSPSGMSEERQLASWTYSKILDEVWTEPKLEVFAKRLGVDFEGFHNQTMDFAMKDIQFDEGGSLLSEYR